MRWFRLFAVIAVIFMVYVAVILIAAGVVWLFTPANAQTTLMQCPSDNSLCVSTFPYERVLPTYCMKDGIPIPACSMTFESHVTTPRCPEGYTLMRYVDNLSLVCARQIAPVIWDDKHD